MTTKILAAHEKALTLCTYCPSLCLHTCPVSTVEARDSVSPWGKMSMADHVRQHRVGLSSEVAAVFYKCLGCRACANFCVHDNDVEGALFTARAAAVAEGVAPFPRELFARPTAELIGATADLAERFHPSPRALLLPGARTMTEAPEAVASMLALSAALDDDEMCLAEASRLDVGYDLWAGGYHEEFAAQAKRVGAAIGDAQRVIVLSAEALYALREIYPRFGVVVEGHLVHASEYLLPLLSGAIVKRLKGKVAYHDSCHLARHLNLVESPRELLKRVLKDAPVDLALNKGDTQCCGGTGCLPLTSPSTSAGAARGVVHLALEAGAKRLVSFSPECVTQLRAVAGKRLKVEHAVELVNQAVLE